MAWDSCAWQSHRVLPKVLPVMHCRHRLRHQKNKDAHHKANSRAAQDTRRRGCKRAQAREARRGPTKRKPQTKQYALRNTIVGLCAEAMFCCLRQAPNGRERFKHRNQMRRLWPQLLRRLLAKQRQRREDADEAKILREREREKKRERARGGVPHCATAPKRRWRPLCAP
jgi:hypothetical protein